MHSGNSVTATLGLLIHAAGNKGLNATIVFPHSPDKTDYITVNRASSACPEDDYSSQ